MAGEAVQVGTGGTTARRREALLEDPFTAAIKLHPCCNLLATD